MLLETRHQSCRLLSSELCTYRERNRLLLLLRNLRTRREANSDSANLTAWRCTELSWHTMNAIQSAPAANTQRGGGSVWQQSCHVATRLSQHRWSRALSQEGGSAIYCPPKRLESDRDYSEETCKTGISPSELSMVRFSVLRGPAHARKGTLGALVVL